MKKTIIILIIISLFIIGGLKIYYDKINDKPSDKQIISDVLKAYKGAPSNIKIEGVFVRKSAAMVFIAYSEPPIIVSKTKAFKSLSEEFLEGIKDGEAKPSHLYYLKIDRGWVNRPYSDAIINLLERK